MIDHPLTRIHFWCKMDDLTSEVSLCERYQSESNFSLNLSLQSLILIHYITVYLSPLTLGGQMLPSEIKGSIEFRDVHFTYPTRTEAPIFSGLSLRVPPGSLTAVVGASGSGKSTIASLILRFYDPDGGASYFFPSCVISNDSNAECQSFRMIMLQQMISFEFNQLK